MGPLLAEVEGAREVWHPSTASQIPQCPRMVSPGWIRLRARGSEHWALDVRFDVGAEQVAGRSAGRSVGCCHCVDETFSVP